MESLINQTGYYIAAFIVAVVIGIFYGTDRQSPLEPKKNYGKVTYVIDGDTLVVNNKKPHIRLWGVDAPEKNEKGGYLATKALIELARHKQISYIEIDRKHGRINARVFLSDGQEINSLMIQSGTATEHCYFSKGFYGNC